MNQRTIALISSIAAWATVARSDAAACSCMEPNLARSYHYASDTIAVRVLGEREGPRLFYRVEVLETFRGCLKPGERVTIGTSASSASCGQPLEVDGRYLLTALAEDPPDGPQTYGINLCGYNRRLDQLTNDDLRFLGSRQVFCEDTGAISCADESDPVQCFQDPCKAERCEQAATCEANTCGGCLAEFYDEAWDPVCEDRA